MKGIGLGMLIAFLIVSLGLDEDNDRLRTRVHRLEMQIADLCNRPAATADLAPVYNENNLQWIALSEFDLMFEDVRLVLETLIREDRWPGREALPRPLSEWPPWPKRGAALIWRKNGWDVTPEEAARIRGILSHQHQIH